MTLPTRLIAIAVVALVVGGAGVHHHLRHHAYHDPRLGGMNWVAADDQADWWGLPTVRCGPNCRKLYESGFHYYADQT